MGVCISGKTPLIAHRPGHLRGGVFVTGLYAIAGGSDTDDNRHGYESREQRIFNGRSTSTRADEAGQNHPAMLALKVRGIKRIRDGLED